MVTSSLEQEFGVGGCLLNPFHILVIGGSLDSSASLATQLDRVGYHVTLAPTPDAAFELAMSCEPDIAILNLEDLPHHGLALVEKICDHPATCTLPIVAISSITTPGMVRQCRAAGCHFYLQKPYDPNVLLLLIQHAIDQNQSWK